MARNVSHYTYSRYVLSAKVSAADLSLLRRPSPSAFIIAVARYPFLFPTPRINYRAHHELHLAAEILLYDSGSAPARSGI